MPARISLPFTPDPKDVAKAAKDHDLPLEMAAYCLAQGWDVAQYAADHHGGKTFSGWRAAQEVLKAKREARAEAERQKLVEHEKRGLGDAA